MRHLGLYNFSDFHSRHHSYKSTSIPVAASPAFVLVVKDTDGILTTHSSTQKITFSLRVLCCVKETHFGVETLHKFIIDNNEDIIKLHVGL